MGRLQYIEVENFKSYCGKHTIGPFDDFTCIVGPNGSGKSNMMDAISFVLGVQSRHLRSSHLKDLIFRKDAHSAPARKSSVKLVYTVFDGEVAGRKGGTEIHFSRVISSAGVSSYRLDNKDVSYETYEQQLQQIGVLVKARNFLVFQGDVESVASKSPTELMKLLEQISGADQYASEYDELLQKKNESEETTIFSMQKKKMYTSQRKEVKDQRDEAELFLEKQHELDLTKTECVLWQILSFKTVMEQHQDVVEKCKDELSANIAERETECMEDIVTGKKEVAKVSKQYQAVEKELGAKEKQLSEVYPKVLDTRSKLKSLTNRSKDLEKSHKNITQDFAQQQENIQGLEHDIQALEEVHQQMEGELATLEGGGSSSGGPGVIQGLTAGKMSEYSQLKQELSNRIAKEHTEEVSLEREISSKGLRLQRLDTQEQLCRQETVVQQQLLSEYTERLTKLQQAVVDGEMERNQLVENKDNTAVQMKTAEKMLEKHKLELEQVSLKLREFGDDRKRSEHSQKMNAGLDSLQTIFKGQVFGRLVNLIHPIQRQYAHSITVAAGKNMDAIVVSSRQVAADCIAYLKAQRIGSCAFLPLDNITDMPIPERLRRLDRKYKLCVDLITYDDKYKAAVSYAFGSTIVCDNLEDAQELCFRQGERVKAVTLAGHSISKSGTMTGGGTIGSSVDRFEEKESEKLRKQKKELEAKISQVQVEMPSRQAVLDMELKLKTVLSRVQFAESDANVTHTKIEQMKQQQSLKEKAMKEFVSDRKVLIGDKEKLEGRLKKVQEVVASAEDVVFAAFSKSVGVSNICEYESKKMKKYQEVTKKRNAVQEQRNSLAAQLAYEKKRDFQGSLARVQKQISDSKKEFDTQNELELTLLQREEKIKHVVKECNNQLKVLASQREKDIAELKLLQSRRNQVASEKDALSKKVSDTEISLERVRMQLHELLKTSQVEEVSLPTIGGHLPAESMTSGSVVSGVSDDVDLHWTGSSAGGSEIDSASDAASSTVAGTTLSRTSTHFSQSDNTAVVRDASKVATIDLSSVRKLRKSLTQQEERVAYLQKHMEALRAEFENIQPNMHAMERYELVLDKLKDCSNSLDKAKEISADISVRFEEVKKLRRNQFQTCFKHISESLGVIYKDLTKSSRHPLGGNAYLTLDNIDEPYTAGVRYTAMPPMKRFRDMDQLSGGEKTVAALALLFSIHSYRQAPFFVLDEVDAALDNVNVKKVCNYMRQRAKEFQCIVISLKDMFFEHADSLIGTCKDVESLSSQVFTLNLKDYGEGSSSNKEEEKDDVFTTTSVTGSPVLGKRKSASLMDAMSSGRRHSSVSIETIAEEEED